MKDRYISADEAAEYFGLKNKDGKPNRRGFLERLACRPNFPKPLIIGNVKTWKLSELEDWADEQRRVGKAA